MAERNRAGDRRDANRRGGSGRAGGTFASLLEAGRRAARRLRAAGARYWTLPVSAVLVGSTLPFWLRPPGLIFSWVRMVEALAAVVLLHAAMSLVRRRARGGAGVSPLSGEPAGDDGPSDGESVGGDAAVGAGASIVAAIVCGLVGAAIGLHLNAATPGNVVLALGLIGIAGGAAYSLPPLSLSRRGLGEVIVWLTLGVLPVVGAYYVQAEVVSWRVVVASLPVAFASVLVLWANEIAQHDRDAAAGKRTLVVILGRRRAARLIVPLLSVLIFAALFAAVFTASHIPLSLVAVLAFGLVRTTVAVFWNHHDDPRRFPEAQDAAVKLHLTLSIVMAGSALAALGA